MIHLLVICASVIGLAAVLIIVFLDVAHSMLSRRLLEKPWNPGTAQAEEIADELASEHDCVLDD